MGMISSYKFVEIFLLVLGLKFTHEGVKLLRHLEEVLLIPFLPRTLLSELFLYYDVNKYSSMKPAIESLAGTHNASRTHQVSSDISFYNFDPCWHCWPSKR